MQFLGLHYAIWLVLVLYFAGMLVMGWFCKRGIKNPESYLLGNRKFGVWMMVMHAFGAGTNPSDTTGTISNTVSAGASGIWVSWMWMFGTPFYWIIAPVVRRMRCLTMADYFRERFSNSAAVLYTFTSGAAMTIFFGAVLLGTTRTVQGMMGENFMAKPGGSDPWFYGVLFVTTITFVLYGYWGGIVAAVRTDMIQGLMIIVLSILAIGPVLKLQEVGGLSGMRQTLFETNERLNKAIAAAQDKAGMQDVAGAIDTLIPVARLDAAGEITTIIEKSEESGPDAALRKIRGIRPRAYLNLFSSQGGFSFWRVILLCLSAPLTAMALPHLMSVCGAGRTEWEGRMGFTYGNMLKRVCTIGWSILGLCWLAYLIKTGSKINPDAAFGDCIRSVLPVFAQGLMLACVMAAAMSSGDAVQVTVGGLFTQSIYRPYFNPDADEQTQIRVTRMAGIMVILVSLWFAIVMRNAFVASIVAYFRILSFVGIAIALGIIWRRMNVGGVFGCIVPAVLVYVFIQYNKQKDIAIPDYLADVLPLVTGLLGAIVGSLATPPPDTRVVEKFFTKIYVPIGREEKLDLSLAEVVPPARRLVTAGGLFIVKPSRQSWIGMVVAAAICAACVAVMLLLLKS